MCPAHRKTGPTFVWFTALLLAVSSFTPFVTAQDVNARSQVIAGYYVSVFGIPEDSGGPMDYCIVPYTPSLFPNNPGGLGVFTGDAFTHPIINLNEDAPEFSWVISREGMGIGLNGIPSIQPVGATLHVAGGGGTAFDRANVFIEDRNTEDVYRYMLRLSSYGSHGILMNHRGDDSSFSINNFGSSFGIDNVSEGTRPFRILNNAPNNLLSLGRVGIGIGTVQPSAALHVFTSGSNELGAGIRAETNSSVGNMPRNMLDLRNNGAVVMQMIDGTNGNTNPWIVQAMSTGGAGGRLQFANLGGGSRANLSLFGDGNIRYTFNGKPNQTVKPNGDVNIIGQPAGVAGQAGGNLNVIGGGGGSGAPGNLFVRGNATVNGIIFGTVVDPSDRDSKENIEPVDAQAVLDKLVELPISSWNYKKDKNEVRHIGPMAQDFLKSFSLGGSDKSIFSMDKTGVALAAIQGLHKTVERKDGEIQRLKQKVNEQSSVIEELLERMERLEAVLEVTSKN